MPIARVQLPDGRIGRFEVPEGTTPEQAQSLIQAQLPAISQPAAPEPTELPESLRPRTAAPEGIPGARQEPGLYSKVRPFVAPVVEALGAGGGALLGGAAGTLGGGPVGTAAGGVAGAGLGYGIAKEALELADVYLGGKAPRQGAAQVIEPARNIVEGAAFEAGGRAAGPVISKVVGKLADLRQMPAARATRIARATLGEDIGQAVNALRNAPPNASVAEITANIQNPAWQALIKDSLEKTPKGAQYLNKFATMSEDEAVNALSKLAGGATAAEARGTTELAKENLNKITGPMRESALARGNLGKYVADEAALREANDLAVMVGSGGQIDPARFVSQAKGAEKALRSMGIKPVEGQQLAQRISGILRDPQLGTNDLIEGSVNQIADDIAKWTDSGGVIDLNALEGIRKHSVNAAIAKLRPGMDATSQRNAAAGVLSRIKPMIDDAIESAGGTGWRDYLTTHSQGMQKIAEKQLSGEARELWKTDKDAFIRLVQNESPDAVEKILGPGKYNIAVELAEDTLGTMRSLADKRLAQLAASKQASEGEKALATVVRENTSNFRLPSVLSFWFSAGNKGISELQKRVGTKSMKVLSEAMQSPEGAANLLERLPTAERNRILQLISDPSKWSKSTRAAVTGGTAATTSNMLAPDREVENRFVR